MALFLPSHESGLLLLPGEEGVTFQVPYLKIGKGPVPVVIVPGLEDGLSLVTAASRRFAWQYRKRAATCRLLLLSRPTPLPAAMSLEQQAILLGQAAQQAGWEEAFWELHSTSGPLGQILAAKRPELIKGLVLASSMHRLHMHTRQVLEDWLQLAQAEQWESLALSSILYSYRPATIQRMKILRGWMTHLLGAPDDPQRPVLILKSLLTLDNRPLLTHIMAPTLVIGGQADRVIPAEIQREMAALIANSRLKLYPAYGHGNDRENPEYEIEIFKFFRRVMNAG